MCVTPHSVTKILQDSLYTLTLNPETSGRFFHRICAFFCVTEYVLFCILVYHMHKERTKESKQVVWAFLVKTICKERNKETKKERNFWRKLSMRDEHPCWAICWYYFHTGQHTKSLLLTFSHKTPQKKWVLLEIICGVFARNIILPRLFSLKATASPTAGT